MTLLRRLNLLALVSLGSLWAGTLVVTGGLLATGRLGVWLALRDLATNVGLTFIVAGQFVFFVVVADRVFPRADHRLTVAAEVTLGLGLLLGVVLILLLLPAGASG